MLSTTSLFAQEEAKIKYGGMQQLGVIIEASRVRAMPNLINGVRYKNWFAGIGVGYEINANWGWGSSGANTMPLYLDVKYYLFKRKWLFALADVGTNLVVGNEWMQNDDRNRFKKYAGYYGNVGLGVKTKFCGKTFYSFDVSYNFKQTRYDHHTKSWQDLWTEEFNNFKQQRILLRFGLEI